MKSKDCKRLNCEVRKFNKLLSDDVFGDRFWIRQLKKERFQGIWYYMFELRDREQPERNKICPFWCVDCCVRFAINELAKEMNNFIVSSDFWNKYNAENDEN